jgi:hypothetical protein
VVAASYRAVKRVFSSQLIKHSSYTPSENGDVSIKTYSPGKRIKRGTCTAVDMGARVHRKRYCAVVHGDQPADFAEPDVFGAVLRNKAPRGGHFIAGIQIT